MLILLGGVVEIAGPAGSVLLVPVSALLTFLTIRIITTGTKLRVVWQGMAVGTIGAFVTFTAVTLSGPYEPLRDSPPPGTLRSGSILVMSGIDSASGRGAIFTPDPEWLGFSCDQTFYYSYTGPGNGAPQGEAFCSIRAGAPYAPEHTLHPSEEMVVALDQQLAGLPAPVIVMGHSQGVWVIWKALADGDPGRISHAVLVGMLPENPVGYPTDKREFGGHVGADVIFLLSLMARPGDSAVFHPKAPLGREFLADPTAVERLLRLPLPEEVRVLSMTSVYDLPLMPQGWQVSGAVNACPIPVVHPHLPWSEEGLRTINLFLDGEPVPPCPPWRLAIGPLARPFSAPPSVAYGTIS